MKNIILISLLCIIQFSSCTKKILVTHDAIDSTLMQNFNYKVGTYWVYKDSITGEEDSFFVNKNTFFSTPNSQNVNSLIDNVEMDIFQYNYVHSKIAQWKMFMSYNTIAIDDIGNIEIDYEPFISVPYEIGKLSSGAFDIGYIVSVNNNYTINSNIYSSVVEIKHSTGLDSLSPKFNNMFYFNNDVGIIKMVLNQDIHNIWELQRWNIIK